MDANGTIYIHIYSCILLVYEPFCLLSATIHDVARFWWDNLKDMLNRQVA